MKGMVIADVHLSAKNRDVVRKAWADAFKYAEENDIDAVFVAGDIYEHFNISGSAASVGTLQDDIIGPVIDYVGYDNPIDREVCFILGNHDIAGPGQKDALVHMDNIKDVFVHRTAICENFGGIHICFLPWITKANLFASLNEADRKNIDAIFEKRKTSIVTSFSNVPNPKVLIGHLDIVGGMVSDRYSMVGGAFEFSRGDIEAIGADLNFFGHIHKEQIIDEGPGYRVEYVGALTQQHFGEEGNIPGFVVFEIDSTGIPTLKRIVNKTSRRFWTVAFEDIAAAPEKLQRIQTGDHVRIIPGDNEITWKEYAHHCKELGCLVQIRPRKSELETKRRTAEDFSQEQTLRELFFSWSTEATEWVFPGDRSKHLVSKLADLDKHHHEDVTGSLDRINEIELINIGRHKGTREVFTDCTGLIAITGPNGAGKTYFLEALFAAAYGEFPSRPGKLIDRITWGCGKESQILVAFRSNGKDYRIIRRLKKTEKGGTHEAYLLEDSAYQKQGDWKDKALAGPKLAAVKIKAIELLGSPDLFLATTYASQEGVGDFINADPRDRKMILAELLGSESLLKISDEAGKKQAEQEKEISVLTSNVKIFEENIERGTGLDKELSDAKENATIHMMNLQTAKGHLANTQAIEKELIRDRERIKAKIERLETVRESIDKAEAELEGHRHGRAELKSFLKRGPEIKSGIEERAELKREISKGEEIRTRLSAAQQNEYDAKSALKNAQAAERESMQKFDEQIHNLLSSMKSHREICDSLKGAARESKNPRYNNDVCTACPLLEFSRIAIEDIETHTAAIKKLDVQIREFSAAQEAERKIHDNTTSHHSTLAFEHTAKVAAIQKEAAEADLDKLKARYDALESYLGEQAKIEGEKKRLVLYDENIARLNEQINSLRVTRSDLESQTHRTKQIEAELSAVQNKIDKFQTAVNDAQTRLDQVNQTIARVESLLEIREENKIRLKDALKETVTINEEIVQWSMIKRAFAKDGIPQLIVDSALPQIHDCVDEVMKSFDECFTIRLHTLGTTQKGEARERMDISITNADGFTQPIEEFSGGEKKLLRTCLRIGFTLFQSSRHGKTHKVFFADEAFDSLDDGRVAGLQEIFRSMTKNLNQVFIGTHAPRLIADIEHQVHLTLDADGRTVIADR